MLLWLHDSDSTAAEVHTARRGPRLHHIALAEEGSPAGDAINEKNRQFLLDYLEHSQVGGAQKSFGASRHSVFSFIESI